MSIFGKIFSKIFGSAAPVPPVAAAAAPAAPVAAVTAAPTVVDVEAVLEQLAAQYGENLMKLVGMESSLAERRELADELGYTGDKQDTAPMNIWLHKQVLRKMAENGGVVPASLLD